jgi:hypothetical protein
VFKDIEALNYFTAKLSPRTAAMLRHIEIRHWPTKKNLAFMTMSHLAHAGGIHLHTFKLNGVLDYVDGWHMNKANSEAGKFGSKLFRDMYPWLQAASRAMDAADGVGRGLDAVEISRLNHGRLVSKEHQTVEEFNAWYSLVKKEVQMQMMKLG